MHEFRFLSTVMDYTASPGEEGASEHAIIPLHEPDTLLAVVRIDGGDGEPHGRHSPFMATRSSDGGQTWGTPYSIGAGSARPRLLLLENGALLLSGGRPGLGVWVDPTGGMSDDGSVWQPYSVPLLHNSFFGGDKASERLKWLAGMS